MIPQTKHQHYTSCAITDCLKNVPPCQRKKKNNHVSYDTERGKPQTNLASSFVGHRLAVEMQPCWTERKSVWAKRNYAGNQFSIPTTIGNPGWREVVSHERVHHFEVNSSFIIFAQYAQYVWYGLLFSVRFEAGRLFFGGVFRYHGRC